MQSHLLTLVKHRGDGLQNLQHREAVVALSDAQ
jgi:hypothetical protein